MAGQRRGQAWPRGRAGGRPPPRSPRPRGGARGRSGSRSRRAGACSRPAAGGADRGEALRASCPAAAARAASARSAGALTTATASTSRSPPVSSSSGTSSTTSGRPRRRAAREEAPLRARAPGDGGSPPGAPAPRGSSNTSAAERSTVDAPSHRAQPGKAAATAATAAPPGASRRVHRASASNTGMPKRAKGRAAVDLPMRDRAGEAEHEHLSGRRGQDRARSSSSTSGSTPNQARKPGRAWCSSMPRPSTTGWPRARATASRRRIERRCRRCR